MTVDTLLGLGGFVVGVVGIFVGLFGVVATVAVGLWAVIDGRRQRSKREKAVIVANATIERTYGLLIGIKPFVAPLGEAHLAATNDGLAAINQRRASLENL